MSMHATWMSFRSLTQDQSVKNQKLKPGTLKRIAKFAIPYKVSLTFFLITVVIDAFLIIATPLLLRKLIDDGVIPKNAELVTKLAFAVGVIAVMDALFSMAGRWFSSRIGEGLIYDLRKQIFEHVQKQSIAFFTRTQTGALISRLNSDVIGAQQAFTSTLSGVISNLLSLILVAITMFTLSWQITLVSLVLLPVFLLPTKWVGRKLQGYTRQSFDINAQMSANMTERFNVSGALLVSLYGDPKKEKDDSKRDFLVVSTYALAGVGAASFVWPLIDQMNPAADTLALASTEIDLSSLEEGQSITVKWRGKPVFVRHRTPDEIKQAKEVLELLKNDSERTYDNYETMLNERFDGSTIDNNKKGLARELARMNLTLNSYTQWYWKTDLLNLLNFLFLRAMSISTTKYP